MLVTGKELFDLIITLLLFSFVTWCGWRLIKVTNLVIRQLRKIQEAIDKRLKIQKKFIDVLTSKIMAFEIIGKVTRVKNGKDSRNKAKTGK
jgi:hypothetical protein